MENALHDTREAHRGLDAKLEKFNGFLFALVLCAFLREASVLMKQASIL